MKTSIPMLYITASVLLIVLSRILSHNLMFAGSIACDFLVLVLLVAFAVQQGKADRETRERKRTIKG